MSQYKSLKGVNQILFAVGHIGPGMLNQFITTWLLLFLTEGESALLRGSLVGVALMMGRVIDAVSDPLVAQISDNLRNHRRGRRIPFILFGTIPMIISFNLLWITGLLPNAEWVRFIWIFVWVNLFYFSYTVVVNPYFALLPEIAKDNKQRMFIQSFVALFGILGMGISMGASGFLIDAFGYFLAGVLLSVLCAVVIVFPILIVKVKHENTEEMNHTDKQNVFKNIHTALLNHNFRNYIIGFAIFFLGFQLIQYNLAFVTTVILELEKGTSSILFICSVFFALIFIPFYNYLVHQYKTAKSLRIAILSYVIVALLISGSFLIPIDNKMVIGFILMALLGFPYSGLMVIPNVIISEIIDEDYFPSFADAQYKNL